MRSEGPWKQFFHPCTLTLFVLAIAVTLWGYGYKVSLYLHLPDSEQIPVAKMWIEHRHAHLDLSAVRPLRQRAATPLSLTLQPAFAPTFAVASARWEWLEVFHPAVVSAHLVSPNSLRAPPSNL